jgi:hypothetical protein
MFRRDSAGLLGLGPVRPGARQGQQMQIKDDDGCAHRTVCRPCAAVPLLRPPHASAARALLTRAAHCTQAMHPQPSTSSARQRVTGRAAGTAGAMRGGARGGRAGAGPRGDATASRAGAQSLGSSPDDAAGPSSSSAPGPSARRGRAWRMDILFAPPNLVTWTRLALLPLALSLAARQPHASIAVFLLSLSLDALDGWLARRLDQVPPEPASL